MIEWKNTFQRGDFTIHICQFLATFHASLRICLLAKDLREIPKKCRRRSEIKGEKNKIRKRACKRIEMIAFCRCLSHRQAWTRFKKKGNGNRHTRKVCRTFQNNGKTIRYRAERAMTSKRHVKLTNENRMVPWLWIVLLSVPFSKIRSITLLSYLQELLR